MKQYRNELALAVIQAMADSGFTFFSSVCINTLEHEYHVPVDFAASDRMFFHIEHCACLVMIEIEQVDAHFGLNAMVLLQAIPEHYYKTRTAFARQNGLMKKVPDPYCEADDFLITDIPGVDKALSTLHWNSTHSVRNKSTTCSCLTVNDPKVTLDNARKLTLDLASYVCFLRPMMSRTDNGMFIQIDGHRLWPSSTFPKADQAFWSAFNSRYFRQLARRVR